MRSIKTWNFIAKSLTTGQNTSLVIMVAAEGDGPNRPGSKLAVDSKGLHIGTVGGGASEYALVEEAKNTLSKLEIPATRIISMTHKADAEADGSGMICSGTQTFALVCLTPTDLPTINKIISASTNNSGGIIKLTPDGLSFRPEGSPAPKNIPSIPTGAGVPSRREIGLGAARLQTKNGAGVPSSQNGAGMPSSRNGAGMPSSRKPRAKPEVYKSPAKASSPHWRQKADSWTYEEPIGKQITVTLIGGGHVSLALTPLLKTLGMRVVVLDNRENLSTMEANTEANEKKVINFDSIRKYISSGSHSYACIMTFGHKNDKLVLAQLAEYPLGYLGMMGSKPKIAQIMQELQKQGISASALDTVYAPIGIPIPSNTPEEIAISIAAQLIKVRSDITSQQLSQPRNLPDLLL